MSELDGIMLGAIRYRSGEGHGQSVEDRAWLLRYLDRQPTVLLHDTEEDRERLEEAVHTVERPSKVRIDCLRCRPKGDAIIAVLRDKP